MEKKILKVYPSKFWHDMPTIIGNKEGLLELKKAIEQTLENEQLSHAAVEETDGHKYIVNCKMYDGDLLDGTWTKLPVHYDEEFISQEELAFLDKFLASEKEEESVPF